MLLLAIVGLLAFLHTTPGKEWVRGRLEARLERSVSGRATIGAVDYGFLLSDLTVRDVRLFDANGRPAVALERVHLDIDRSGLWADELVIPRVVLEGARIAIHEREQGGHNLKGLYHPSGALERPVQVAALTIRDVAVEVHKADGSVIRGSLLEAEGSARMDPARNAREVVLERARVAGAIVLEDGAALSLDEVGLAGKVVATGTWATGDFQAIAGTAHATIPGRGHRQLDVTAERLHWQKRDGLIQAAIERPAIGPLSANRLEMSRAEQAALSAPAQVSVSSIQIDHRKLNALLEDEFLAADISGDLEITPTGDTSRIAGSLAAGGSAVSVTGSVDPQAAGGPAMTVRLASDGLRTRDLVGAALRSQVPEVAADFQLDITGRHLSTRERAVDVQGTLGAVAIDETTVLGVDVAAGLRGRQVTVERATLQAFGVDVDGRGQFDLDRREVEGAVRLEGHIGQAMARAGELGVTAPEQLPAMGAAEVELRVAGRVGGPLDVRIEPSSVRVLGGRVDMAGGALLSPSDGDAGPRDSELELQLHNLSLRRLAALAGWDMADMRGRAGGRITIDRQGQRIRFHLTLPMASPPVVVSARGRLSEGRLVSNVAVHRSSDDAELLRGEVSLPLRTVGDDRRLSPERPAKVVLTVPERDTGEWLRLLPPGVRAKRRLPRGRVALEVDLAGSASRPRGTVILQGQLTAHERLPLEQNVRVTLRAQPDGEATQVVADGGLWLPKMAEEPVVALAGHIGLPALFAGDRPNDRLAEQTKLHLTADMRSRPISGLAPLQPLLARLSGVLAGHVALGGTGRAPTLDGEVAWSGFETVDGGRGRVAVEVHAALPDQLRAQLSLGQETNPATVVVTGTPAAGGAKDAIALEAVASASAVPFTSLFPMLVTGGRQVQQQGQLDWDMRGAMTVVRMADGVRVREGAVTGRFDVTGGTLPIPGSNRVLHDIEAHITSSSDRLAVASISARETHPRLAQESEIVRTIRRQGDMWGRHLVPERVAVRLQSERFLLFGPEAIGQADAPRVELDADIGIEADFARDVAAVQVAIDELKVIAPERYIRAHMPEDSKIAGDVVFVDDSEIQPGRFAAARQPATQGADKADDERSRRKMAALMGRLPAVDLSVRTSKPAQIQFAPVTTEAEVDLRVALRGRARPVVRGRVDLSRGALGVMGQVHTLEHGHVVWDESRPNGYIDIAFGRTLPSNYLRDVSHASAGSDRVRILLSGPIGRQEVSFDGAAGSRIFEAMAAQNVGHSRFVIRPDMPAGPTVRAPHADQHMVLTYMADHLPHLLFLDRFSAWADPYDARDVYGQLENFDGENVSRKRRIKVVARPPTPGRSRVEVHGDRLLIDDRTKALGVGVRAGSRLGGGIGVFLEWSSRD